MADLGGYIFIGLQLAVYIFSILVFLPVFKDKGQKESYRKLVKVIFSLVTIACFRFVYHNGEPEILFPDNGFEEFMILTLMSCIALYFVYFPSIITSTFVSKIGQLIIGILFWLSLLTSFKFLVIIHFAMFPVFGFMVFAPYVILLISFYEINYIKKFKAGFSFLKTILISLIFLFIFQLAMNFWGDEKWELIKLFTLDYKLI